MMQRPLFIVMKRPVLPEDRDIEHVTMHPGRTRAFGRSIPVIRKRQDNSAESAAWKFFSASLGTSAPSLPFCLALVFPRFASLLLPHSLTQLSTHFIHPHLLHHLIIQLLTLFLIRSLANRPPPQSLGSDFTCLSLSRRTICWFLSQLPEKATQRKESVANLSMYSSCVRDFEHHLPLKLQQFRSELKPCSIHSKSCG
ncbi:hypothetical protein V8F44DRAFT_630542 [Aspergillus fumigatus]